MMGVPPSGSGHSAEPEPVVSALRASVPNADDLIDALTADIREIEALCHMETRQKLLRICNRALDRIAAHAASELEERFPADMGVAGPKDAPK